MTVSLSRSESRRCKCLEGRLQKHKAYHAVGFLRGVDHFTFYLTRAPRAVWINQRVACAWRILLNRLSKTPGVIVASFWRNRRA